MNNKYEITQNGLAELKKELAELKNERNEVIETIKVAKSFGDLSENAEYSTARERQTFVESRIQDIEDRIKKAIIVDVNHNKNIIGLGSKVEIVQLNNSTHSSKIIELVSSAESDPLNGKISSRFATRYEIIKLWEIVGPAQKKFATKLENYVNSPAN